MSNSQEQSLDENAVFLPVDYTSPGFLHCETERQGMERLLSAGPESFYTSIALENSSCFISPEEVSQIDSWAQDYRIKHPQEQRDEDGGDGTSEMEDFHSTYFPSSSNPPVPSLDLGWPEKTPFVPMGSVTVHTSPPTEGERSVREIIRRHLQTANQVIAVVTDRLTDGPIIADLHNAASHGVPVYIILNHRSMEEDFTLSRLMHPNIRVRVLQGRSFCSRSGRMVVGEMKNKFLLVDLETVIHGSYSLTWTDAHLHRQLITVLRGPVVESFDREFRILFAASLPVPEKWRFTGTGLGMAHQFDAFSDHDLKEQLSLGSEITKPPSSYIFSPSGWEESRDVRRHSFNSFGQYEEIMDIDKETHIMDGLPNNETQFLDVKWEFENRSPVTYALDESTFNNTQSLPLKSATLEEVKREDDRIEETRQISLESNNNLDDGTTMRLDAKLKEPTQGSATSKREPIPDEESSMDGRSSPLDKPSPKRPIILRVPQSDDHIMSKLSSSGIFNRGSKVALSEMSQSMMDLSVVNTDTNPRFSLTRFRLFGKDHMTPASALMKSRNDDVKSVLHRTPKTSRIGESFNITHKWKTPSKGKEEKPETISEK